MFPPKKLIRVSMFYILLDSHFCPFVQSVPVWYFTHVASGNLHCTLVTK